MLTLVILLYCTSKLVTATEQCDTYLLSIPESLVRRSTTGTPKLTISHDIIGLLILLVMYTVIWSNE